MVLSFRTTSVLLIAWRFFRNSALDLREYEMPIPKIDMTSVRTILGHKPQAMENSHGRERYANCEDWQKLEECCYLRATNQKSVPPNYRNTVDVMDNSTPNTRPAIVAQNGW